MDEVNVHLDSIVVGGRPAGETVEAVEAAIRIGAGGVLPPELLAQVSRAVTESLADLGGGGGAEGRL